MIMSKDDTASSSSDAAVTADRRSSADTASKNSSNRSKKINTTRAAILAGALAVLLFCLRDLALEWGRLVTLDDGRCSTSSKSSTSSKTGPAAAAAADDDGAGPVHVLFALSGGEVGFHEEFKVALKSVLMNGALDRPLTVHVMCDQAACDMLRHQDDSIFPTIRRHQQLHNSSGGIEASASRADLRDWVTRQPVRIATYNVEPHLQNWTSRIRGLYRKTGLGATSGIGDASHTIGAFFRLFAHEVVVEDPGGGGANGDGGSGDGTASSAAAELRPPANVIYLDTDVAVLSNLEVLWNLVQNNSDEARARQLPPPLFYMGEMQCSGFLVLNLPNASQLWDVASHINLRNVSATLKQRLNDQLVFRAINGSHPELVGMLPEEWDMSIADGIWRFKKNVVQKRPKVGMLHFNGGGASKDAYYETHDFIKDEFFHKTFAVADYYARLPWPWARYMVESNVPNGVDGYRLTIRHHETQQSQQR